MESVQPPAPQQAPKAPPPFNDIQLQFIIALAADDAKVAAFLQAMDKRAEISLARSAIVSNIAYQASLMLEYRQAMRAQAEETLKQKAAQAVAKPPPAPAPVEAVPEAPEA